MIYSFLLINSFETAETICEKLIKSYQILKKKADMNDQKIIYIRLTVEIYSCIKTNIEKLKISSKGNNKLLECID